VAQLHSLNANLIFKWLRDPRFASAPMLEAAPVFLPVQLRADGASEVAAGSAAAGRDGQVEVVLSSGHRLSAFGAFDGDAVARLLAVLVRS
jgi:transposase